MRAMGSLTVQAPTRDTMLLWLPGWWCALKIRCGVVVRRLGVVKWLVWWSGWCGGVVGVVEWLVWWSGWCGEMVGVVKWLVWWSGWCGGMVGVVKW